jgi:hypothetical protein
MLAELNVKDLPKLLAEVDDLGALNPRADHRAVAPMG